MMYYGQRYTDKCIAAYFPTNYTGVCVEVGAYDGVKGSNTLHFEQRGWRTLCIEPNPYIFPHLERYRLCKCIHAACDNYIGDGSLEVFDFKSGVQSSLTSLSVDPRLVTEYADAIEKRHRVTIPVRTLNDIFHEEQIDKVDFISIDTEGTELRVLKGLNLNAYKPKLLVVENNYDDKNITEYLKLQGYTFSQRYFVNNFYVRDIND